MEIVRAKDTGTLQYDLYFNDDQADAGDQLVPAGRVWADDDWLEHASLADRIGERSERLLVEMLPRLVGIRVDVRERSGPSAQPPAKGAPL